MDSANNNEIPIKTICDTCPKCGEIKPRPLDNKRHPRWECIRCGYVYENKTVEIENNSVPRYRCFGEEHRCVVCSIALPKVNDPKIGTAANKYSISLLLYLNPEFIFNPFCVLFQINFLDMI